MGEYPDETLNITKEMDAQQKIQDVAKKLCLLDGQLWEPTIDANKPGGLTDEERKELTLQQEEEKKNKIAYVDEATIMYDRLSQIDYTITTK